MIIIYDIDSDNNYTWRPLISIHEYDGSHCGYSNMEVTLNDRGFGSGSFELSYGDKSVLDFVKLGQFAVWHQYGNQIYAGKIVGIDKTFGGRITMTGPFEFYCSRSTVPTWTKGAQQASTAIVDMITNYMHEKYGLAGGSGGSGTEDVSSIFSSGYTCPAYSTTKTNPGPIFDQYTQFDNWYLQGYFKSGHISPKIGEGMKVWYVPKDLTTPNFIIDAERLNHDVEISQDYENFANYVRVYYGAANNTSRQDSDSIGIHGFFPRAVDAGSSANITQAQNLGDKIISVFQDSNGIAMPPASTEITIDEPRHQFKSMIGGDNNPMHIAPGQNVILQNISEHPVTLEAVNSAAFFNITEVVKKQNNHVVIKVNRGFDPAWLMARYKEEVIE